METEEPQIYDKFPLKAELVKGLEDWRSFHPFITQENILLPILQGKDLSAESEACLGKLLAIALAALQIVTPGKKNCQVLIIMPTRELCLQLVAETKRIGKYLSDLSVVTIYGGGGGLLGLFSNDKHRLKERHSILVATPGALFNAIEKDYLGLKWIKLLVLDGADEVVDGGLKDRILRILKFVPPDVQMAIILTTKVGEVQNLIDICLRDPVYIGEEDVYMDMRSVTHYKVSVENEEEKVDFLRKYYDKIVGKIRKPSIIFCKKDEDLEKLVRILKEEKFNVGRMDHRMLKQERLKAAYEFFRSGEQILVTVDYVFFDEMKCTQSMIPLIINYDVPARKQDYQKNFGIMKRFSRKQIAINLVTPEELLDLGEIEEFYGIKMKELPLDDMMKNSSSSVRNENSA